MHILRHASRFRWSSAVVVTALSLSAVGATGLAAAATAAAPSPAPGVAPGAADVSGTNYVFYTATDGTVQAKSLASGGQTVAAGGHLAGAPAPITTAVGHDGLGSFVVFGRGTDNALWYTTCEAESPTVTDCGGSWASLGGALSSGPAAVEVTGDTYSVFVRGSDGAVWGRNHVSTGWSAWYRTGGAVLSGTAPSAAYANGTYVLVVGTNRELYIQHVGTTGFTAAGGETTASPALIDAGHSLAGFVSGTNHALWYHEFLQSAPGWHSLGGDLSSGVAATGIDPASATTQLAEYALGSNGQVWQHSDLTSGGWSQVTP